VDSTKSVTFIILQRRLRRLEDKNNYFKKEETWLALHVKNENVSVQNALPPNISVKTDGNKRYNC